MRAIRSGSSEVRSRSRIKRPTPNLEAVGRLVNGVAHDFNNLLTGIMLYCDLMCTAMSKPGEMPGVEVPQIRGQADLERVQHCIREIRGAGERGAALIQQLMTVASQEAGTPAVFSWNDIILELRDLLSRLIGENLVLETDLAADLNPMKIEPVKAQQVIMNLVLNARDAMPEGGKIVLQTANGTSALGGMTEVAVIDNGSGMDERTRARIFQPFFTTKKTTGGHGLGLATVNAIVREAGGQIQVQSCPGRGTAVIVSLPTAAPDVLPHGARKAVSNAILELMSSDHRDKVAAKAPLKN